MKATEIQIGDRLYYKGQFNAFDFRVEQVTKRKIGYHAEPQEHRMHYLRLDEVQPILLNPNYWSSTDSSEYRSQGAPILTIGCWRNTRKKAKDCSTASRHTRPRSVVCMSASIIMPTARPSTSASRLSTSTNCNMPFVCVTSASTSDIIHQTSDIEKV